MKALASPNLVTEYCQADQEQKTPIVEVELTNGYEIRYRLSCGLDYIRFEVRLTNFVKKAGDGLVVYL